MIQFKKSKLLIYILYSMLCIACSSTKEIPQEQLEALDVAVHELRFKINAKWAYPLSTDATQILNSLQPSGILANGNRIRIDNSSGFLRIADDSIAISLPYFGVRQISGGYLNNTGIKVNRVLEDWQLRDTKKNDQRVLSVTTRENGETYTINLRLFAKNNASIVITSSQRQSIRYEGVWEEVPKVKP